MYEVVRARSRLTGFYLYNRSDEPCANYFGTADQNEPNRFADPVDYILKRRPQILAHQQHVGAERQLGDGAALRMTGFPDNNTLTADFDPATLGFSQTYLNQITVQKFPQVRIRDYDQFAARTLGAIEPTEINWKSIERQRHLLQVRRHAHVQVGRRLPQIGVDYLIPGNGAGSFDFEKDITSSNGCTTNSPLDGNSFASFLLGFPSARRRRGRASMTLTTPLERLHRTTTAATCRTTGA